MTVELDRLSDYLEHILQAIARIERYAGPIDEETFKRDEMVQDAVIRNLEVIGEASGNIMTRAPKFAAAHPELPLASAYQMRNAVAHGYYKVDLEIVWRTIAADLPGLRAAVQAAARECAAARGAASGPSGC